MGRQRKKAQGLNKIRMLRKWPYQEKENKGRY